MKILQILAMLVGLTFMLLYFGINRFDECSKTRSILYCLHLVDN